MFEKKPLYEVIKNQDFSFLKGLNAYVIISNLNTEKEINNLSDKLQRVDKIFAIDPDTSLLLPEVSNVIFSFDKKECRFGGKFSGLKKEITVNTSLDIIPFIGTIIFELCNLNNTELLEIDTYNYNNGEFNYNSGQEYALSKEKAEFLTISAAANIAKHLAEKIIANGHSLDLFGVEPDAVEQYLSSTFKLNDFDEYLNSMKKNGHFQYYVDQFNKKHKIKNKIKQNELAIKLLEEQLKHKQENVTKEKDQLLEFDYSNHDETIDQTLAGDINDNEIID